MPDEIKITKEDLIQLSDEKKAYANQMREKAVRDGVDALIKEAQSIPDINWVNAVSVHVKAQIKIF